LKSLQSMLRIETRKYLLCLLVACALLLSLAPQSKDYVAAQPSVVRFAVIGDYGWEGPNALAVSNMVREWNPDLIITTGDNNYDSGSATTIDRNIGQYYHDFIAPYNGNYGAGAEVNRFFPALGNHDWATRGARPYLNYFTLPGNERYYDFVAGSVHFFAIDSQVDEPDGITSTSTQAAWLQNGLANSTSPWNIVYMHHPPYSSGGHGSSTVLQWPYREWGATAVLTGHDHTYERLLIDDLPYFVNGLGGRSVYGFLHQVEGSQARYNGNYGAMVVQAAEDGITFEFFSIADGGTLIDTYTLGTPYPISAPNAVPTRNYFPISTPTLTWSRLSWAKGYRVQVDNNSDFSSPEVDDTTAGDVLSYTTRALPNAVYYWHVRGKRADDTWGAWSIRERFTIWDV
jgi:tartrate-resistant acid phosphatase type 5